MIVMTFRKLGEKLTELDKILLVTGGFLGVGDTVATNFHKKELESQKSSSVWHVLPVKDEKVRVRDVGLERQ